MRKILSLYLCTEKRGTYVKFTYNQTIFPCTVAKIIHRTQPCNGRGFAYAVSLAKSVTSRVAMSSSVAPYIYSVACSPACKST